MSMPMCIQGFVHMQEIMNLMKGISNVPSSYNFLGTLVKNYWWYIYRGKTATKRMYSTYRKFAELFFYKTLLNNERQNCFYTYF